jgi:hypothetical protein
MLRNAHTRRTIFLLAASVVGLPLAKAQTQMSASATLQATSPGNELRPAGQPIQGKVQTGRFQGNVKSIAGMAGWQGGGMFGADILPVVGAPFSAVGTSSETTTFADGNRVVRTTKTNYFRDAQGRTRVERQMMGMMGASNAFPPMPTIFDPITGEMYHLNPQQRTADQFPSFVKQPAVQAPVQAPPIQPGLNVPQLNMGFGGLPGAYESKTTDLGEKFVDGLRVEGTKLEYTVPVNTFGNEKPVKVVAEQWFSPELGVIVASSQRATIGMQSTYKLENIERAEQDSSLFVVPSDYTKREPMQGGGMFRLESTKAAPTPPQ